MLNLCRDGGFLHELLNILGNFCNPRGLFRVNGFQQLEEVFEQARRAQQKIAASADSDGKSARHRHIKHVAQFAEVGVFAANAVSHAGVNLREGQGKLRHIAARVLIQLVLNARRNGMYGAAQ